MKCTKCGLKANSKRNQSERTFMMTKGKEVLRGTGERIVNHYCSKCQKRK